MFQQKIDDFLHQHSCIHLTSFKQLQNALYVTSCSKAKSELTECPASEMYTAMKNKVFKNLMKQNNQDYFILSDKYGLIPSTRLVKEYNIHPSDLDLEKRKILGKKVARQLSVYSKHKTISSIVLYQPRIMCCIPYVQIISFGLQIFNPRLPFYLVTKKENFFKTDLSKSLF